MQSLHKVKIEDINDINNLNKVKSLQIVLQTKNQYRKVKDVADLIKGEERVTIAINKLIDCANETTDVALIRYIEEKIHFQEEVREIIHENISKGMTVVAS